MDDLQGIILNIAVSIPGLLLAIVVHEVAHGYTALKFGDRTALMAGRLTLNPTSHLDMFGTVFLPIMLSFFGFVYGYAKPVPVDVRNFKNMRKAIFWVSFAGPLSNLILGSISAFLLAFMATQVSPDFEFFSPIMQMLRYSVLINFLIATFNLLPLPPLDGYRMLGSVLRGEALRIHGEVIRYSFPIFMGIMMLSFAGIHILSPILAPALGLADYLIVYFSHLMM
jgi:Zn-dependent protease